VLSAFTASEERLREGVPSPQARTPWARTKLSFPRLREQHMTTRRQTEGRLAERTFDAAGILPGDMQAFTCEDRARGGHARAEKIRRRKELREQFDVAELEGLTAAEPELLDRALARLNLLIGPEDRVALRAVKEVLERTLGRPRQRHEHGRSQGTDMDAALAAAREKLTSLIARHAARSVTTGEQQ
jgi:hypothetical protein